MWRVQKILMCKKQDHEMSVCWAGPETITQQFISHHCGLLLNSRRQKIALNRMTLGPYHANLTLNTLPYLYRSFLPKERKWYRCNYSPSLSSISLSLSLSLSLFPLSQHLNYHPYWLTVLEVRSLKIGSSLGQTLFKASEPSSSLGFPWLVNASL
jgi:hypothetical protein